MAWLVNMISPDVRRPIDILTRTKSLQAQQYRAFMRAALPALHDAPLEILRLVAAQVLLSNDFLCQRCQSRPCDTDMGQIHLWQLLRSKLPTQSLLCTQMPEAVIELQQAFVPFRQYSDSDLNFVKYHRMVRLDPYVCVASSRPYRASDCYCLLILKEHCYEGGLLFGAISAQTAESAEGSHKPTKKAHRR